MKKKNIILTIAILCLISIIFYFGINYKRKKDFINKIKNSYNQFVITNKDTVLYSSDYNTIGNVSKDTYFELDNFDIKSKNDVFFKIKDNDYYLYYDDVIKTDSIILPVTKDYYLDLGKEIITGDVSNFYKDGVLKLSINNSFTFNVIMMDDNYYYVSFLSDIYQIKKDEVSECKDINVDGISSYISVLNYDAVSENCSSNNCISVDEFKKHLEYLKENGYYTINIDDYKLWLSGYINLKEKAIFITSKQDGINDIASLYGMVAENNFDGLSYIDSNYKSEKGNTSIPRYNIIDKTTFDLFKKIVNGESITYVVEKPILQAHTLPLEGTNASRIAVLNYHFFYDPSIGESCPDGNCKKVQDFENELNYLKKNNYKTLTMDEFTRWMYGEIELPARSVLITIDDGAMGTGSHNGNKLIPLLEKYQAHATLFLITGWWPIDNYKSSYLDIESHTNDMHEGNYCEGVARGSKLLCSSREKVLEDISKSIAVTGSKNAFCFPMYVYNDTTFSVLNELGIKLAFVGGDVKATRSNDKYKVPRYHIYRDTSLDQFINMIS